MSQQQQIVHPAPMMQPPCLSPFVYYGMPMMLSPPFPVPVFVGPMMPQPIQVPINPLMPQPVQPHILLPASDTTLPPIIQAPYLPLVTSERNCTPRAYERLELPAEESWSSDGFSDNESLSLNAGSSACSSDFSSEEQPRGHKQQLITQVRETLTQLLGQHFTFQMDGSIMSTFAYQHMPQLDELKDVLRGNNVGNIRAKSVRSLNSLTEFLQKILACTNVSVHRVDVILQKKKSGHLKGLLVNIQFSSQEELVYIRDVLWIGGGYEHSLPKFMPAVFAQDCSWAGCPPRDLHFEREATSGDLRVQDPLPEKLQNLGLEAPCRIKSISVIFNSTTKKAKTFEIPKEQFFSVLSQGTFTVKGVQRKLNEKARLTISFEEDWKTNFWRR